MENSHRSGTYTQLFLASKKPSLLEAYLSYTHKLSLVLTSAIGSIIFCVIGIYVFSPKFISILVALILFALVGVFIIILIHLKNFENYTNQLTDKVYSLRNCLLFISNINPQLYDESPLQILGISDNLGSVNIVVKQPRSNWLKFGSLLDVMASASNDCWGSIKIVRTDDGRSFGDPIDRKNPVFWEDLEDRMRYDQSPPPSVYLEPHIPTEVREIIKRPTILGEKTNG